MNNSKVTSVLRPVFAIGLLVALMLIGPVLKATAATITTLKPSLSAASGHENGTINRDVTAERLTPEALTAAQQRAAKLLEEIEARKAAQN